MLGFSREHQEFLFILFYFPLFAMTALGLMGQGFSKLGYYTVICAISLAGFLWKALGADYSITQWLIIALLVLFLAWNYPICHEKALLLTFMSIIAIKNVEIRKMARYAFWLGLILTPGKMAASKLGLIDENVREMLPKMRGDGSVYYMKLSAFGYDHPNHAAALLLSLLFLFCIAYGGVFSSIKNTLGYWIVGTAVSGCSFVLLGSKMMLLTWFVFVFFQLVCFTLKRHDKMNLLFVRTLSVLPFIFGVFLEYMSFEYPKRTSLSVRVNAYMNNRLYAYAKFHGNHTWKQGLLHSACPERYGAETGYLVLAHNYGVVFGVIALIIVAATMIMCYKQGDKDITMILAVMSIYYVMENYADNAFINVALLYIGKLLFDNKKNNGDERHELAE